MLSGINDHFYHEKATLRVRANTIRAGTNVIMVETRPGSPDSVCLWLSHDQAWHLRDELNKLLADGCPTTIDTDGLHADVHAAIVAVGRVAERVGLKKEVTANAG